MKLSPPILFVLAACATRRLGFARGKGIDAEPHLQIRDISGGAGTESNSSITTSTPFQSPSSITLSGKGPETLSSTRIETIPTISLLSTAEGPEVLQSSSSFISIPNPLETITTKTPPTSSSTTNTDTSVEGFVDGDSTTVKVPTISFTVSSSGGLSIILPTIIFPTQSEEISTSTSVSTSISTSVSTSISTSISASVSSSVSTSVSTSISTSISTDVSSVELTTDVVTSTASGSSTIPSTSSSSDQAISTTFVEASDTQESTSSTSASDSLIVSTSIEIDTVVATETIIALVPTSTTSTITTPPVQTSSFPTAEPDTFSNTTFAEAPNPLISTTDIETSTSTEVDIITATNAVTIITAFPTSTSFVAQSEVGASSTAIDTSYVLPTLQTGESAQATSSAEAPTTSTSSALPTSDTVVALPDNAPTSTIVPLSGLFTFVGCFTEGIGIRALQGGFYPDDNNTVSNCVAHCYPMRYAGLEYGRECWCGEILNGGASQVDTSDCSMPCAGDEYEVCGDSIRLALYQWKNNSTESLSSSSQNPSPTSASSSSQAPPSTPDTFSTTPASSSTTTVPTSSSQTQISVSTQTIISGFSVTQTSTLPGSTTTEWSTYTNAGNPTTCLGQVTITITETILSSSTPSFGSALTTSQSLQRNSSSTTPSLTYQTTSGASMGECRSKLGVLLGFGALMLLI